MKKNTDTTLFDALSAVVNKYGNLSDRSPEHIDYLLNTTATFTASVITYCANADAKRCEKIAKEMTDQIIQTSGYVSRVWQKEGRRSLD